LTLRKLLQKAVETGRRIRSETTIMRNNLSYPAITHKIIKENKLDAAGLKILVIGNGNLGKSCIRYFLNKNADITLATRNPEKFYDTEPALKVISRKNASNMLKDFSVIIGATTSAKVLVTADDVKNLSRKTVFVDLAVPGNFDPEIKNMPSAKYFDLEYIFHKASIIKEEKDNALGQADRIIEEEEDAYIHWLKGRKAVKIISTLKEELEIIKMEEKSRFHDDFGGMDLHQKKIINNLVNRLTSRIAHIHYSHIKDFVVHEQS